MESPKQCYVGVDPNPHSLDATFVALVPESDNRARLVKSETTGPDNVGKALVVFVRNLVELVGTPLDVVLAVETNLAFAEASFIYDLSHANIPNLRIGRPASKTPRLSLIESKFLEKHGKVLLVSPDHHQRVHEELDQVTQGMKRFQDSDLLCVTAICLVHMNLL